MRVTVAERGQITIPKPLRNKLGIKPGMVLDFNVKNKKLIAIKVDLNDPVLQVYGCLKKTIHTDNFIRELRGE